ncbi:MAG: nucleoside-triphosphatase [Candidatus Sigynarchaeota archaeon]
MRGTKADIVFLDEIGPMELKSDDFKHLVDDLVRSDKHLVAVVHNRLAACYDCIEITIANRNKVPGDIASKYCNP